MGFPMEGVSACLSRNDKHVLHGESYKRLTPPRNTTKQRRPTVNPSDRQSAQLTDKAPGTIERAGNEVSRMTPTSTATLHASSTAAPSQHHTDPAGSSPESSQPTQPSAHRMHMRAEPHGSTDTSGDRRHPPYGEPYIRMNWWTTTDTWPASVGGGGGGGGSGAMNEEEQSEGKRVGKMREQVARRGRGMREGDEGGEQGTAEVRGEGFACVTEPCASP